MSANMPVMGIKKQLTKKTPWIIIRALSHLSGRVFASMERPVKNVESAIMP